MQITRPKPLAEQVNALLRSRIREGTYSAGSRLPSESDLAAEFGVSRATVRTVLAKLASEGLILRRQGDGTYVNEHIQDVNAHLGGLWEFSRLIESSGHTASIQTLKIETRTAGEGEAGALGIQPGDEVVSLRRLFLADDQPVILAANVIPAALVTNMETQFDGQLPIRAFLKEYCQRYIAYVISEVQGALVNDEAAEHLAREPGSPLLVLRTSFYDRDNQPLAFGQSYFDDQRLRLRLVQAWV